MREQLELLPGLLAAHVQLVIIALVVCVLASIPLGVAATRSPRTERLVVGAASVVQTIQDNPLAPLCLADVGQDQWFCTRIGCDEMTDCGADAGCLIVMGEGSACLPCECEPSAFGCGGGSTTSSASSTTAATGGG